jgi:RND family efflux transporter MFP subunit
MSMRQKTTLTLTAAAALVAGGILFARRAPAAKAPQPMAAEAVSTAIRCEGRLVAYPGSDVIVSAEYAGRIAALPVKEKDAVKRGQLVAQLDDREQRAALAASEGKVRELDANLVFLRADRDRLQRLVDSGVANRRDFEQAATQFSLVQAQRDSAQEQAGQLRAALSKLAISSPIDGIVVERLANAGELLPAGAHLVRVADLRRVRVEAEVDEYDLARLQVGAAVEVLAEGAERPWTGHVEEIPDSVTGRQLKAQDPSRPVDIRVALVKVAVDQPEGLKLGQRVELKIQPKR